LSFISGLIWTLVISKANQGAKASQTKSSKSVQSMLKSTGYLISMIAVASLFKFGAEMSTTTPVPMTPKLKASGPLSP
jgi:hypothetical protein